MGDVDADSEVERSERLRALSSTLPPLPREIGVSDGIKVALKALAR